MPRFRWSIEFLNNAVKQIETETDGLDDLKAERFVLHDTLGNVHVFNWANVLTAEVSPVQEQAKGN